MNKLMYGSEIFQEGDVFVARCPELDVSSFGDTPDEARDSLQEAVEAVLEGCGMLGTLEDVLEDSGFVKTGTTWRLRERVREEKVVVLP